MTSPALKGSDMRSVMLVDDQAIFRRAAAALVRSIDGLEIVGEAATGEDAVQLARRLQPDLVVMDVRLPGIDGIEATRQILSRQPTIRVLLVSTHDLDDLPAALSACGAAGFLRKQDLDAQTLTDAARISE
jgi:two-component system, NarL family, invasion response regulator UvrY